MSWRMQSVAAIKRRKDVERNADNAAQVAPKPTGQIIDCYGSPSRTFTNAAMSAAVSDPS